jgi:hypothetical protein
MLSGFQNRSQVFVRCGFALLLFQWCGCASHLAVVKTKPAQLPRIVGAQGPLQSAETYLAAAEHEQSLAALGRDLLAARLSYGVLERQPKNESARSIYNFAVARVVQDVDRADLEPWRHSVTVMTDQGRYTLESPKPVDADHDPSRYDLFPTDTLKIGGKFFETYSTVSGLGAPIAVVGRTESSHFVSNTNFAASTRPSPRSSVSPAAKRAWSYGSAKRRKNHIEQANLSSCR